MHGEREDVCSLTPLRGLGYVCSPSPLMGALHNSISVLSQDQIDDLSPFATPLMDSRLRGNDVSCAKHPRWERVGVRVTRWRWGRASFQAGFKARVKRETRLESMAKEAW